MVFKEDMIKRRKMIFKLLMKRKTIDEVAAETGWSRATICRDIKRHQELRKAKEKDNVRPSVEEISDKKDTDPEKLIGMCSRLGWW